MSDAPDQKVSLGCGTLIVIGLIVLFLGNANDTKDVERKLDAMNKKLERIEKRLESRP
ncbi:MAG: hypothetical protein OSA93_14040 [Akkermansiaceae bacterium]|jgi:hypothetical protein|nr:hypothetical protein [Akkermansiaceae bacterium]